MRPIKHIDFPHCIPTKQNEMKFAWTIVNGTSLEVNRKLFETFSPTRRPGPSLQLHEQCSRTDSLKKLPTASIPHVWNKSDPCFTDKTSVEIMVNNFKLIRQLEYGEFTCTVKDCYSCQP